MKKYLIILALMVSLPLFAEHVDPETARKAATTFLSNNGAKATQLTDLSKVAGFPCLYIFNAEEGFVVMAADDRVKPILGYSLTEKFVSQNMPENLTWWLQGYNDQIQDVIANKLPLDSSAKTEWQALINGVSSKEANEVVVGPLISTLWDQNYPYNYYCPAAAGGPGGHVYAGCVATAMAQIMKYWNYPATGTGSYSYTHSTYGELTVDFGGTTYDWGNMPNSISSNSSQTAIDAIATLIYHCGVAVDMNYGTNGSGALSQIVADIWKKYFRFSPHTYFAEKEYYTDSQWLALLKSELDEHRPVYYWGFHSEGGHAFICDGYRSDNYFHFNWGWSSNGNGYYAIGTLNPGGHTYNLYNGIVALAEPISDLEAPTLSASSNENGITLSWNLIDDATSYNVYKNNIKIATGLTSNTYFDNNVSFGEYPDYFVRAVSSEPNMVMSNPSDRVTVPFFARDISPSNLTASTEGNNIHLQWDGYPANNSTELHYATIFSYSGYNSQNTTTYWGQRYPSTLMSQIKGMLIEKITAHFYFEGNYHLLVYNGSLDDIDDQIYSTSFNIDNTEAVWKNFVFDEPLQINCNKDLWIVFYTTCDPSYYPATGGNYYGDDISNANYISSSLETLSSNHLQVPHYSWLIRTFFTDGTYTYNLYEGETKLNGDTPINGTSYSITGPISNGIHQYTATTNYYGGESDASNKAGLTLGSDNLSSLDLGTADKMTVAKSSTLTVGTLTSTNPENLILEDGAQLINSSTGVKATVKKTIEGFQTDDNKGNWYLIASPITEQLNIADSTNLKAANPSDYDLYIFNQSSDAEWRNYKQDHFTTIDNKTGYLYAHRSDIDIEFAGTLNNTNGSVPISYTSDKPFAEYNLVGNPFPCNATIDKTDYYRIVETQEGSKIQLATTSTIAPMEGIFVKAVDGNDKTVTFSKETAKGNGDSGSMINISVSRNPGNVLDNARIRFDGDLNMEKLILHDGGTQLYIPQSGLEYALVVNDDFADVPVCFKAANNGTYTLNIDIKNLDLDYLHLIDNLTGANIDLLTAPSYSFEATTDNYPSRFRLLFNGTDENPNVFEDIEGDILIMDVTGRVVGTDRNAKLTPGVYVVRTVNGNDIQTKKIIIK